MKRVGVVLFENVELLDFAGPVEVLHTARVANRDGTWARGFDVLLIAERAEMIRTAQGVQVVADKTLHDCPSLDVLLVPGGWGTRAQMKNPALLEWLRLQAAAVELTTSVCTGSLVLGRAGLLDGRRATTHWHSLDVLRDAAPEAHVVSDEHVVRDGNLLTSAGVAAGIDLALYIVAHYYGEAAARSVARGMEYPYPESNARRVVLDAPAS